jgi:hypothetical protein
MGEIILKFDSVEEANDARTALDGHKWKHVMWDLDQRLRAVVKYNAGLLDSEKEATDEEANVADKLREVIREILQDNNLSLEY